MREVEDREDELLGIKKAKKSNVEIDEVFTEELGKAVAQPYQS